MKTRASGIAELVVALGERIDALSAAATRDDQAAQNFAGSQQSKSVADLERRFGESCDAVESILSPLTANVSELEERQSLKSLRWEAEKRERETSIAQSDSQ